jgi:hypothetical protein
MQGLGGDVRARVQRHPPGGDALGTVLISATDAYTTIGAQAPGSARSDGPMDAGAASTMSTVTSDSATSTHLPPSLV